MVTPNQRRTVVKTLCVRFGVSQRRACMVINQHRSTQRHCVKHAEFEELLRSRIRALAVKYPRYGLSSYPRHGGERWILSTPLKSPAPLAIRRHSSELEREASLEAQIHVTIRETRRDSHCADRLNLTF